MYFVDFIFWRGTRFLFSLRHPLKFHHHLLDLLHGVPVEFRRGDLQYEFQVIFFVYENEYASSICFCKAFRGFCVLVSPFELVSVEFPVGFFYIVYFLLTIGSPKVCIVVDIMIGQFFQSLYDEKILPEISDVSSILQAIEIIDESISYAEIPEIYFMGFVEFFPFVCKVGGETKNKKTFLKEIYISVDRFGIDGELSGEFIDRNLLSYLEREELEKFNYNSIVFYLLELKDISIETRSRKFSKCFDFLFRGLIVESLWIGTVDKKRFFACI